MAKIDFLFDFGSPNAYLAHRVIPGIIERTGAVFDYQPVLLGGLFKLSNNKAPMVAFGDIPKKMAYQRIEMDRFVRVNGLTKYRFNPHFPINTLNLMRGAVAAQTLGQFETYIEAVFCAMWEDQQQVGDPEVLAQVLTKAGLDAKTILELSQTPDIKAKLGDNTQAAYDRGAFGIPTFFVGDEIYFGKDQLLAIEAELRA